MEFNLDAISSALDEILAYHNDIEKLDTFSSRSQSASNGESRAGDDVDAKHLNDSRWGEGITGRSTPSTVLSRRETPIQQRRVIASSGSPHTLHAATATGAIITTPSAKGFPVKAHRGAAKQDTTHPAAPAPLAPRPSNRDSVRPPSSSSAEVINATSSPSRTSLTSRARGEPTDRVEPSPTPVDETGHLDVNLVSASGIGAAAFLTHTAHHDAPGKTWVTYYAKSTTPYVVVRCAAAAHGPSRLVEETAPTVHEPGLRVTQTRDLQLTFQLQLSASELEAIPVGDWGTAAVACSREAKRGFVRAVQVPIELDRAQLVASEGQSPSSPGQPMLALVPLRVTVPGSLLAAYVKLTLLPRHDVIQVTHACRVSGFEAQWASTWSENSIILPALRPPSLRDEFDALTPPPEPRMAPSESVFAMQEDADEEEAGTELAPFEQTTPEVSQQRAPAAPPSAPRTRTHVNSYYYDWVHDDFYDSSPSAAMPETRPAASSWQHALDDTQVADMEAGFSTPRRHLAKPREAGALHAWDASPMWSLAQCLAFGQHQAAFLSIAIAHASEAERCVSVLSLSALPFAFHICALRFPRGEKMSSLTWLTTIHEALRHDGLRLDLASRVLGGGFLGAVCEGLAADEQTAAPATSNPRWVLIVPCTTTEDVTDLLRKCHATATHVPSELATLNTTADIDEVGTTANDRCCLRIVLDWTRSFEAILPVLRTWGAVMPTVQYFGAPQQPPLCHLMRVGDAAGTEDDSADAPAGTLAPVLWSGMVLDGDTVQVDMPPTSLGTTSQTPARHRTLVSLTLSRRQPFFRVWQSVSSPTSPRVVLTDQHVLQSMGCVHGALVSPTIRRLAMAMVSRPDGGFLMAPRRAAGGIAPSELTSDAARFLTRLVEINEAPWQSLSQTWLQQQLPHVPFHHLSDAARTLRAREATAFADELARITRAWVFHALTTAFRREWGVVGLCLPERAMPSGTDATTQEAVWAIDEDAFMDTILHWGFPYPRAVIVFHPCASAACTGSDATCFSPASLQRFARAQTLEESVA